MNKSQIVIGINANHADSSACILINGKLIAAVEEERINRIKHFSGYPIQAINECLNLANINQNQITDIAFNTKPLKNLIPKTLFLLKNYTFKDNNLIKRFKKKIDIKKILFDEFKLNKDIRFHYIEHHLAHLASAFFPSNFDKAYGLSIDGSGDFVTLALAKCENNKIEILKRVYFPDSLGIFYHAMTQFLGFKNYGDEYKIMGLAAYGKPIYFNKLKDNLFQYNKNDFFQLNLKYFNHHKSNFKYIADEYLINDKIDNKELTNLFQKEIKESSGTDQFTKDFAASAQAIYEFFLEKILDKLLISKFSKNIIYAGGCALNSSANRLLLHKKKFDKVHIPFAPGDNGGALGAAFIVATKANFKLTNTTSPYLGAEFKNEYIDKILNNEIYKDKINYKFIEDDEKLFKQTATLISEGNVVGWFQGKMEFGPRSLGNRSILADPRNPNMKSIINTKIKRRESFRPFAPSVLDEYQAEWFESNFDSPYMSSLARVKETKKSFIPAVTHFDGTARFQTVKKSTNARFASLIKHFYLLTKVPILLNTSFNENEPIVMKPEEALECILRTDMDAVIINNFLIRKK